MQISSKTKNILIVFYVLFIILAVFYVNSMSKYTKIEQMNEPKTEQTKSTPVNVTLVVNGSKTYVAALQSSDSVSYLLDRLRQDKEFTYEKTRYTYGTEINVVNGEKALDGYKWKIFQNGKDITFGITDIDLGDKATYELKLVAQ